MTSVTPHKMEWSQSGMDNPAPRAIEPIKLDLRRMRRKGLVGGGAARTLKTRTLAYSFRHSLSNVPSL